MDTTTLACSHISQVLESPRNKNSTRSSAYSGQIRKLPPRPNPTASRTKLSPPVCPGRLELLLCRIIICQHTREHAGPFIWLPPLVISCFRYAHVKFNCDRSLRSARRVEGGAHTPVAEDTRKSRLQLFTNNRDREEVHNSKRVFLALLPRLSNIFNWNDFQRLKLKIGIFWIYCYAAWL